MVHGFLKSMSNDTKGRLNDKIKERIKFYKNNGRTNSNVVIYF